MSGNEQKSSEKQTSDTSWLNVRTDQSREAASIQINDGVYARVCAILDGWDARNVATEWRIEASLIEVLAARKLAEHEIRDAAQRHPSLIHVLLTALAFNESDRRLLALFSKLSDYTQKIKSIPNVGEYVLRAAIIAASDLDVSNLKKLRTMCETAVKSPESFIFTAVLMRNPEIAMQLLAEMSGDKGAEIAITANLSPALVEPMLASMSHAQARGFIDSCATFLFENRRWSEYAVILSKFVKPGEISEASRGKLSWCLLENGVEAMNNWLYGYSSEEKSNFLKSAYSQLQDKVGFQTTGLEFNWIEVAKASGAVSPELLQKAIESAAYGISLTRIERVIGKTLSEMELPIQQAIYKGRLKNLINLNPDEAVVFYQQLPTLLQESLAADFAKTLVSAAPERALDLLRNSNGDIVTFLEDRLLVSGNIGVLSMADRRQLLERRLLDTEYLQNKSDGVSSYAYDLFLTDTASAISFISNIPESPLRVSAISTLAALWASNDPVAASEWIVNMPHSMGRDEALSHMVMNALEQTSEAWENAFHIGDEKMRLFVASEVIGRIKLTNSTGAKELIANSGYTDIEKRELSRVVEDKNWRPAAATEN